MAEVKLENICKSFGAVDAVRNMSLHIDDGSFVVLLGPTGAGKTTTMRVLSGLEKPESGHVYIDGQDVTEQTPAQRNVAMVFQQYSLYPHLSVYDNLAFPLRSPLLKTSKVDIAKKVQEVAEVLHISHKLKNRATELSGGEMQRVSIGRALVRDPDIYLMDEPLSSLDAKLRADLRMELKRLQADLGSTLLYVTHDQIEAMTMATHVGVLDEGVLTQFGSPREIYEEPSTLTVASRLGLPRINIVPADLFGAAPAQALHMGLRPEHLKVEHLRVGSAPSQTAGASLTATVRRVEPLGDQTRLHMQVQDHALVTVIEPGIRYQPGQDLQISPVNPLFFNADGNRLVEGKTQ